MAEVEEEAQLRAADKDHFDGGSCFTHRRGSALGALSLRVF